MAQDIKYTDNCDIDISSGDFEIIVSDYQHTQDIIELSKGELKEFPLACVGIDLYDQAPNVKQSLEKEIRTQIQGDSATINYLSVHFDSNGKALVDINANY